MKRKIIFIITILFFVANGGFSQSGWQAYPYSPSGSVLNFPYDDGKHTDVSIYTEWWYLNMHIIGSAPNFKKYDVMLCYFRKPSTKRVLNIADPVSGTRHSNVNPTSSVLFTQQIGRWDLLFKIPFTLNDSSNWTYPEDSITYKYFFHTEEPDNDDGLDITLTGNRPPLIVGGNGFVAIGNQGDSSFYYTYSNMKVEGTIKFNGITDSITSGIGWIDRQWGPFYIGGKKYEWFSLQMDNPGVTLGIPQSPSEFNVWQIFSGTNNVPYKPEWRIATAMYPDTTQDTSSTFIFERTGYWHDPVNNKYFSQGWRFINPLHNINVDITSTFSNQIVASSGYWEGGTVLKGTIENKPFEGVGFAELVGGNDFNIIVPSTPTGLTVVPVSNYNSLNWSASIQGTYPIGGYRIFRSPNVNGYWQYIASTADNFYNDYSALPDSGYYYTVTSFDNQTATSASSYANPVCVNPLGINNISKLNKLVRIFPNPVNDKIVVELPQNANIEIINMQGQIIENIKSTNTSTSLDLRKISSGIYTVKIKMDEDIIIKKLIKQ